jgi:hypothetical protein
MGITKDSIVISVEKKNSKPKVRHCGACGFKLNANHHAVVKVKDDPYDYILHKECADNLKKGYVKEHRTMYHETKEPEMEDHEYLDIEYWEDYMSDDGQNFMIPEYRFYRLMAMVETLKENSKALKEIRGY